MIEILILSIIQGVTEFLPVSSSSHLVVVSNFFNFNNQNLSIDVSLHIGSFFAVLYYFKKEILDLTKNKKTFLKIIVSSLPVMLVGYILIKLSLIDYIRSIKIIGWTTIIFGILLYLSDRFESHNEINVNFNYKSAFFIGFLQVISLIPGVSRSGITITAARFLKFNRVDSAKISFYLSIPTLGAVSFYGINNLIRSESLEFSMTNLFSIFFSFIFSLITIKYFLKYIKSFNLTIFVAYRLLLGFGILAYAYL